MLEPGTQVDRYVVEEPIGEGGMAQVYKVRHDQLGSRHALKILAVRRSDTMARMLREGRAQAGLRHPNLVPVTDVLDIDGTPGLVMDLIEGPSLQEWLDEGAPVLAEAEAMFRGIVAGVAEAHAQGLVHRDLKPQNILLEPHGEGFIPRVADFGLVKAIGEEGEPHEATRTGSALGTPAYMAPEQVMDAKAVDQRADIYSLGCILYRMVSGERAFDGDNALSILNRVVSGQYTPIRDMRLGIPPRVSATIEGCLRTKREDRIGSCEQLIRVLDGEETLAAPAASIPRPGARMVVVLTALMVVLVGVLASGVPSFETSPVDVPEPAPAALEPEVEPAPDPPAELIEPEPAPPLVEPEPEPEAAPAVATVGPHEQPCGGKRAKVIGYAQVPRGRSLVAGALFVAPKAIPVRREYPNKKNAFAVGTKQMCRLEAGDVVTVVDAPIETPSTGTWLPVQQDAVKLRPEG